MRIVTINGKSYNLKPTLGRIAKLLKNSDTYKTNFDFLVAATYLFLEPKFLFIKPFVFKYRLASHILVDEINDLDTEISSIIEVLNGDKGDKELGNVTRNKKKNTS